MSLGALGFRLASTLACVWIALHAQAQGNSDSLANYRPSASAMQNVNAAAARAALASVFKECGFLAHFRVRGALAERLRVDDEGFSFTPSDARVYKGPTTFAYADLPEIEIRGITRLFGKEWHIHIFSDVQLSHDKDAECPRRLADALFVLRREARGEGSDDGFQAVVAGYRVANPKPAFPEEARRFRVQAEFAVEQKRFGDAVRYYREALTVAPWWPEGRFNLALVLAETKRYPRAIAEMKKFLALEPQHPQARSAQDQIYRWESVPR
jgi:tetratricopeptide (TPR) repeat protein